MHSHLTHEEASRLAFITGDTRTADLLDQLIDLENDAAQQERDRLADLDELENLRAFRHRIIDAAQTTDIDLIESFILTGQSC